MYITKEAHGFFPVTVHQSREKLWSQQVQDKSTDHLQKGYCHKTKASDAIYEAPTLLTACRIRGHATCQVHTGTPVSQLEHGWKHGRD